MAPFCQGDTVLPLVLSVYLSLSAPTQIDVRLFYTHPDSSWIDRISVLQNPINI